MIDIAILGATASGKTSLSIELAKELNANILSLDSLSIYREIDIASAKPSLEERDGITHFGIDEIGVDEEFNVTIFFELYKKAKRESEKEGKNLIIVGGTGFYLKSMIEGLSDKPKISLHVKQEIEKQLQSLHVAYELIEKVDIEYAQKIASTDSYRIEKWLEIYLETKEIPSKFFAQNQKEPIIKEIDLYEIDIDRDLLRERISLRTQIMLDMGLLDEVFFLENRYTRKPNAMKSIGIKEGLDFFDGGLNKEELKEKIITNTSRLAKRQRTFNASQFKEHFKGSVVEIKKAVLAKYKRN